MSLILNEHVFCKYSPLMISCWKACLKYLCAMISFARGWVSNPAVGSSLNTKCMVVTTESRAEEAQYSIHFRYLFRHVHFYQASSWERIPLIASNITSRKGPSQINMLLFLFLTSIHQTPFCRSVHRFPSQLAYIFCRILGRSFLVHLIFLFNAWHVFVHPGWPHNVCSAALDWPAVAAYPPPSLAFFLFRLCAPSHPLVTPSMCLLVYIWLDRVCLSIFLVSIWLANSLTAGCCRAHYFFLTQKPAIFGHWVHVRTPFVPVTLHMRPHPQCGCNVTCAITLNYLFFSDHA